MVGNADILVLSRQLWWDDIVVEDERCREYLYGSVLNTFCSLRAEAKAIIIWAINQVTSSNSLICWAMKDIREILKREDNGEKRWIKGYNRCS